MAIRLMDVRKKPGIYIATCALLVLVLCLVRSRNPARPLSSPLTAGLHSGMSRQETKTALNIPNTMWKEQVIYRTANAPTSEVVKVDVLDFPDCGVTGTLSMAFVNDKLMRTTMAPSDLHRYLDCLRGTRGIRLSEPTEHGFFSPSQFLSPATSIDIGRDGAGTGYVRWEDRNLAAQVRDLIE